MGNGCIGTSFDTPRKTKMHQITTCASGLLAEVRKSTIDFPGLSIAGSDSTVTVFFGFHISQIAHNQK